VGPCTLSSGLARFDFQAAWDLARDTQATFQVLLAALAGPGTVVKLPVAARGGPVNPWLAAVLITLLDAELSLAVEPFDGSVELERFVRERTRAAVAPAREADFVVAPAARCEPGLCRRLRRGSAEWPDESASLILLVESLDQTRAGGPELLFGGPGVAPGRALRLGELSPALPAARADACADYPRGIDLYLLDRAGRLVALPRATTISLLAPQEAA
jgi:alpha-D-ribose 1-methylphosphonate 5-triphosphate synthase subunit PhnH